MNVEETLGCKDLAKCSFLESSIFWRSEYYIELFKFYRSHLNFFHQIFLSQIIVSHSPSGKKPRTKAPRIQRLVTPRVLQHKRRRIALKRQRTQKNKEEASEYAKLLAKRMKVMFDLSQAMKGLFGINIISII